MVSGGRGIIVTSKEQAESSWISRVLETYPKPVSVISIVYPDDTYPVFLFPTEEDRVLRLKYWDYIREDEEQEDGKTGMVAAQADATAVFLHDRWAAVGTLFVHCNAGISRSAGTALAAACLYNLPADMVSFICSFPRCPNPLVVRRIITAHGKRYRDCRSCEHYSCTPSRGSCIRRKGNPTRLPEATCRSWTLRSTSYP